MEYEDKTPDAKAEFWADVAVGQIANGPMGVVYNAIRLAIKNAYLKGREDEAEDR